MSVDNKNKVEVGNAAVNRRCQVRTFCMEGQGTNHNDHDFPHRNCKLIPGGYQERRLRLSRPRSVSPQAVSPSITRKRRSFSTSSITDRLFDKRKVALDLDTRGRTRVRWPQTGNLDVQLYPSRAIESTSVVHLNFLLRHLTEQPCSGYSGYPVLCSTLFQIQSS